MSEKKRIRTSSTLSFAGWCKVVQSKEEECVGCEESSTEMERQCAKLFDTERKCVKLFDTQNVQSNVRRWKVGTTSHHPSSLAEKRFFYESEILKLVALQARWHPKFTFSTFTPDPNLQNPHFHKTQIYTNSNLHSPIILAYSDLHNSNLH